MSANPISSQSPRQVPEAQPPEEGKQSELDIIVSKANGLATRALAAYLQCKGTATSYDYYFSRYGLSSSDPHRVSESVRSTLLDLDNLETQRNVFETEKEALVEEFASFDSVHHVTYISENKQVDEFIKLIKEIEYNIFLLNKDLSVNICKFTQIINPHESSWCAIL